MKITHTLLRIFLHPILFVFFKKEYLTGRYFEKSLGGYLWAVRAIWTRNILRLGRPHPFPVGLGVTISNSRNLIFHPDDLNNFQVNGTYFQNVYASITIGKGTYIAPNVGLITANHDIHDLDSHTCGKPIRIGNSCWIGMNSTILPGVILGERTIVGAGSVVTKSFPEGKCIVAGNPARIIRTL